MEKDKLYNAQEILQTIGLIQGEINKWEGFCTNHRSVRFSVVKCPTVHDPHGLNYFQYPSEQAANAYRDLCVSILKGKLKKLQDEFDAL
uniref:Uncharacterized protein n=1 Tax=viral metagenome TaxID=1070528 RepID=A0A6M3Y5R7_9ZZZZ